MNCSRHHHRDRHRGQGSPAATLTKPGNLPTPPTFPATTKSSHVPAPKPFPTDSPECASPCQSYPPSTKSAISANKSWALPPSDSLSLNQRRILPNSLVSQTGAHPNYQSRFLPPTDDHANKRSGSFPLNDGTLSQLPRELNQTTALAGDQPRPFVLNDAKRIFPPADASRNQTRAPSFADAPTNIQTKGDAPFSNHIRSFPLPFAPCSYQSPTVPSLDTPSSNHPLSSPLLTATSRHQPRAFTLAEGHSSNQPRIPSLATVLNKYQPRNSSLNDEPKTKQLQILSSLKAPLSTLPKTDVSSNNQPRNSLTIASSSNQPRPSSTFAELFSNQQRSPLKDILPLNKPQAPFPAAAGQSSNHRRSCSLSDAPPSSEPHTFQPIAPASNQPRTFSATDALLSDKQQTPSLKYIFSGDQTRTPLLNAALSINQPRSLLQTKTPSSGHPRGSFPTNAPSSNPPRNSLMISSTAAAPASDQPGKAFQVNAPQSHQLEIPIEGSSSKKPWTFPVTETQKPLVYTSQITTSFSSSNTNPPPFQYSQALPQFHFRNADCTVHASPPESPPVITIHGSQGPCIPPSTQWCDEGPQRGSFVRTIHESQGHIQWADEGPHTGPSVRTTHGSQGHIQWADEGPCTGSPPKRGTRCSHPPTTLSSGSRYSSISSISSRSTVTPSPVSEGKSTVTSRTPSVSVLSDYYRMIVPNARLRAKADSCEDDDFVHVPPKYDPCPSCRVGATGAGERRGMLLCCGPIWASHDEPAKNEEIDDSTERYKDADNQISCPPCPTFVPVLPVKKRTQFCTCERLFPVVRIIYLLLLGVSATLALEVFSKVKNKNSLPNDVVDIGLDATADPGPMHNLRMTLLPFNPENERDLAKSQDLPQKTRKGTYRGQWHIFPEKHNVRNWYLSPREREHPNAPDEGWRISPEGHESQRYQFDVLPEEHRGQKASEPKWHDSTGRYEDPDLPPEEYRIAPYGHESLESDLSPDEHESASATERSRQDTLADDASVKKEDKTGAFWKSRQRRPLENTGQTDDGKWYIEDGRTHADVEGWYIKPQERTAKDTLAQRRVVSPEEKAESEISPEDQAPRDWFILAEDHSAKPKAKDVYLLLWKALHGGRQNLRNTSLDRFEFTEEDTRQQWNISADNHREEGATNSSEELKGQNIVRSGWNVSPQSREIQEKSQDTENTFLWKGDHRRRLSMQDPTKRRPHANQSDRRSKTSSSNREGGEDGEYREQMNLSVDLDSGGWDISEGAARENKSLDLKELVFQMLEELHKKQSNYTTRQDGRRQNKFKLTIPPGIFDGNASVEEDKTRIQRIHPTADKTTRGYKSIPATTGSTPRKDQITPQPGINQLSLPDDLNGFETLVTTKSDFKTRSQVRELHRDRSPEGTDNTSLERPQGGQSEIFPDYASPQSNSTSVLHPDIIHEYEDLPGNDVENIIVPENESLHLSEKYDSLHLSKNSSETLDKEKPVKPFTFKKKIQLTQPSLKKARVSPVSPKPTPFPLRHGDQNFIAATPRLPTDIRSPHLKPRMIHTIISAIRDTVKTEGESGFLYRSASEAALPRSIVLSPMNANASLAESVRNQEEEIHDANASSFLTSNRKSSDGDTFTPKNLSQGFPSRLAGLLRPELEYYDGRDSSGFSSGSPKRGRDDALHGFSTPLIALATVTTAFPLIGNDDPLDPRKPVGSGTLILIDMIFLSLIGYAAVFIWDLGHMLTYRQLFVMPFTFFGCLWFAICGSLLACMGPIFIWLCVALLILSGLLLMETIFWSTHFSNALKQRRKGMWPKKEEILSAKRNQMKEKEHRIPSC